MKMNIYLIFLNVQGSVQLWCDQFKLQLNLMIAFFRLELTTSLLLLFLVVTWPKFSVLCVC